MSGTREASLRLPYLDGLRALAAAYVVLFHAVQGFSAPTLSGGWRVLCRAFAFGHEAVAIFIVLSGYCLMLPVVKRSQELTVLFGRFLRRRALRILPPYFAALFGSLLLIATFSSLRVADTGTIWDDSLPGLRLGPIASHLALVHNWFPAWTVQINGPLWSVATEWQIYFFFPLLLLPAWRRTGPLGALLLACGLGYAPLLLAPAGASSAGSWYLALFCLGMLAASVGLSSEGWATRWRAQLPWGAICLAIWLGCGAFSTAFPRAWFSHKPVTDPLVGLATATLLVHLTQRALSDQRPSRLLRLLESPLLVGLGHFSYSLYLTHLPIMALCYFALVPLGLAPGPLCLALILLSAAASLAVAYAFHRAFERPFMIRR